MHWWQLRKRRADLERELQSDLDLEEEEQRDRGLPPGEARYAARRAFGNPALIREQTHEAWGWATLERLLQDLRFALRQCVRNKRFAAICILTLALGIAAQTTMYSVIHAVLIDPYPYRGAMRMVHIHLYDKDPNPFDLALDGEQFAQFQGSPVLDGALADDVYTMALTGGELPQQLQVNRMSANAFDYFGVPALLGRGFGPSDSARVAVLSYHFWNAHFAGRKEVIGQSLQLDGQDYEIVGVMPPRFAWMGSDVYIPLPYAANRLLPFNVYARLRAGVPDRQAELALEPLLDAFARQTPANFPTRFTVHVVHINQIAIGRLRGFLLALFFAVSVLLALACVNVAILMLARGESRRSEIAIRGALGAAAVRIVRQLMTESLLLSLAGGALGILLAFAGARLVNFLIRPMTSLFPPEANIALNTPVLLFGVAISVLTGVACGLWPALRLCRAQLRNAAESGTGRFAGKTGTRKTHAALLAGQVALTILLLACSGATVQKLLQLLHTPLGYEPRNLGSVGMVLREGSHNHWSDRIHYYEQIRRAVAGDPELISAAIGNLPPGVFDFTAVNVPAMNNASGRVIALEVSPEYFSTVGIPLLRGRLWTSAEITGAAHLALINESMRRRYWPSSNPIGQTFVLNNGIANSNGWRLVAPGNNQHFLVIGVVGDAPNRGLDETVAAGVYIPYSMMPYDGFNVVFRARINPTGLLNAIKEDVHRADPGQAVGDLITADDALEGEVLGRERFIARLFTGFALLGLAFAVCGLYSIQSYFVAQRTRELGLRMALGARRSHIVAAVTRTALASVSVGTAMGILASVALGRVFADWTSGNIRSPQVLIAVCALLFCAAASASAGPALKATTIDPIEALRTE